MSPLPTAAHVLVRNSLVGGGARAVTLAVGLVITPYLLDRLGDARFGVWALTTVVTGFAGVLDLSFKSSFVKFLAERDALDDELGYRRVVTTSLAFYAVFGIVTLGLFAVADRMLLDLLRIPAELRAEAADVFLIALIGLVVGSVLSVYPAMCDARQRIDLTNTLGVGCLLLSTCLTVLLVEGGGGLRGVASAQLVGIVLFHAGSAVLARRVARPVGLATGLVDRRVFRRQLAYGLMLHVSSTCTMVNRQLDKLLLSRWAGLGPVTSYEVGLRIAANAGSFQPFLAATLLPAASGLHATGDRDRLVALYLRASRYLFMLGVPAFVFLAAHAPAVVTAWLGSPHPMAAHVLRILAAGYMVNSLSNAMAFVCQGIGRVDIQAGQSAAQLVANIVLSVALFWLLGPLGAPAGTSLAFLFGAALFAVKFHPVLGITTSDVLRRAAGVPVAASLLAVTASTAASLPLDGTQRLGALVELLAAGAAFGAVYLVVCWWAGVLGSEEIGVLRRALRSRRRQEEPG